jgi:hypothetical protein
VWFAPEARYLGGFHEAQGVPKWKEGGEGDKKGCIYSYCLVPQNSVGMKVEKEEKKGRRKEGKKGREEEGQKGRREGRRGIGEEG